MMSQMMKAAVFLCCMRSADFCRNENECLLKIVQKYDSQIIKNVIKYKKYDKRLIYFVQFVYKDSENFVRDGKYRMNWQ